ncbi:MAG: hypothetical protein R3E95_04060 [Thiolinea sp.]
MARYLHQQGYRVFVPAYTSLRRSPAVNARHLLERYQQDLSHFDAVHLVGRCLGGLVALHLLAHCPELPPAGWSHSAHPSRVVRSPATLNTTGRYLPLY